MNASNKTRGPEGTNHYISKGITLGHNLLAINGTPENSIQPSHTAKSVLAWNGCLYDVDAEKELDTNVLQRRLDAVGIKALRGLNGSFAIAYVSGDILYLARDHFGQKPLYWCKTQLGIIFSSTIFGIIEGGVKAYFSQENVKDFQRTNYWQNGQKTPYSNIHKIAPGQILKWDLVKQRLIGYDSCWDNYNIKPKHFSHFEYRGVVIEGILRTARTNKRLALLHSGGLDSNLIGAVLGASHTHNFFSATLRYEENLEFDDTPYKAMQDEYKLAMLCTKEHNIEHHIFELPATQDTIDKYSRRCLEISGSIFEDSYRMIPRFYLLERVAQQGAKVVLGGDGGDEIFTGYRKHADWVDKTLQAKGKLYDSQKTPTKDSVKQYIDFFGLEDWFPLNVIEGVSPMEAQMFIDLLTSCETYLLRSDAYCGAFGMESRTPFLYQDLAKYVLEIPLKDRLKIGNNGTNRKGAHKGLIRDCFQDIIPNRIINRQGKVGWSLPYWRKDPKIRIRRLRTDQRMLESIIKEQQDERERQ
jgi:asparagine synthase (glutamine-hydrolysing)